MQHFLLLQHRFTTFFAIVFVFKFTIFAPTLATRNGLYPNVDQEPEPLRQHRQSSSQQGTANAARMGHGGATATPKVRKKKPTQNSAGPSVAMYNTADTSQYNSVVPPQQQQHYYDYQGETYSGHQNYGHGQYVQQQTAAVQPNYTYQPLIYNGGMAPQPTTAYSTGFMPSAMTHQQQYAEVPQVPDLLTGSMPVEQPPPLNSSVSSSSSSSLGTINTLMDQMSIDPKKKGTMEIYYTQTVQKKKDENGQMKEIELEIYRQRDNSGNFVKFRHVNKLTGETVFSCVAPMPKGQKGMLKLFFNNNTKVPYLFDVTGYMIVREEQFSVDEITGKPIDETIVKSRLYDKEAFENWIADALKSLLKEPIMRKQPAQPSSSATIAPVEYPRDLVLRWVGVPLPVHPNFVVPNPMKIGFMNSDIKIKPTQTMGSSVFDQIMGQMDDKIMEQMDDGGNWFKIEVKQQHREEGEGKKKQKKPRETQPKKYSNAIFVRDKNGQMPNTEKPIVLFFNGRRQYFDKTGMAISRFAVEAMHRWEEKANLWANDPVRDAFLAENKRIMEKERAKAQKKAAEEAAANAAAQPQQENNGMPNYQQHPHNQQTIYVSNPNGIMVGQPQQHLPQPLPPQPMDWQWHSYGYHTNPMNQPLNARWNAIKMHGNYNQRGGERRGNPPPAYYK